MIAHSNKQIEPQASTLSRTRRVAQHGAGGRRYHTHLHLHRAAPLERISASDDEVQIVSPQLAIVLWRASVGVLSRSNDSRDWDGSLETLFTQCETLELWYTVPLGDAVDSCVLEDDGACEIGVEG